MSLFHLLNDLRKVFLGEQAFDDIFMALPFLYGDRTTFWSHCWIVVGSCSLVSGTESKS